MSASKTEHYAEIQPAEKYGGNFRRQNSDGGIGFVYGYIGGEQEVQAIRFKVVNWTAAQALAWLSAQGWPTSGFQEAKPPDPPKAPGAPRARRKIVESTEEPSRTRKRQSRRSAQLDLDLAPPLSDDDIPF